MGNRALTQDRRLAPAGNTDTDWLKIVALVFMMIDHLAVAIFTNVPEMRMIGRIAMPLYVWCLVVGCVYTHNIQQYALRLFVVALISQPINMIALGNSWNKLNILFLLCLGVISIAGIQKKRYGSQFWVPLLCFAFLGYVQVDYGWKGLAFILLMYAARNSLGGLAATFLAFALFWGASNAQISTIAGLKLSFLSWPAIGSVLQPFFKIQAMMWLALPFILIRTHMNWKLPKWLAYGFYPLHLLVIIVLRLLLGDAPGDLFSVLWTF